MPFSKASARASSDVEVVAGKFSRQHFVAQNAPAVTMPMPTVSADTLATISKTLMPEVFLLAKPHVSKRRNKSGSIDNLRKDVRGVLLRFSFSHVEPVLCDPALNHRVLQIDVSGFSKALASCQAYACGSIAVEHGVKRTPRSARILAAPSASVAPEPMT